MASYRLSLTKRAAKEIAKLPAEILVRIDSKITALVLNPFPSGCKKLSGSEHTYRLRDGDYRVVYLVDENEIVVVSVGHRREIYR